MTGTGYPSLGEIVAQHAPKGEYERYLFASRFIFRPPSFPAIWLLVRLGLTGEGASWLSGLSAFLGFVCLLWPGGGLIWPGVALLVLFNFFDCLDGGIARALRARNPYGRFLDSMMSWADMLFWPVIGVVVWRDSGLRLAGNAAGADPLAWLAVGFLCSFFSSYYVYLEGVFDEVLRPHWEKLSAAPAAQLPSSPLAGKSGPEFWARVAVSNLRVRETHYLLLIPVFLYGAADLMLSFFLLFYAAFTFALVLTYCRRGREVLKSCVGRETAK